MQRSDISETTDSGSLVSVYPKGKISSKAFAEGCKKIRMAFPDLPGEWYKILDEMLEIDKWNDDRFRDAVYNLIRTIKYPKPKIADMLNYDKKERRYFYEDLLEQSKDYESDTRRNFLHLFEKREDGYWYKKTKVERLPEKPIVPKEKPREIFNPEIHGGLLKEISDKMQINKKEDKKK